MLSAPREFEWRTIVMKASWSAEFWEIQSAKCLDNFNSVEAARTRTKCSVSTRLF